MGAYTISTDIFVTLLRRVYCFVQYLSYEQLENVNTAVTSVITYMYKNAHVVT